MKGLNYLWVALFLMFGFVSCSSDREDMPEVPDEGNVYPTQEEYQNKIANRLWVIKESKWTDDDGNIYPPLQGEGGFADSYAYYFLSDGYIVFPGEYPFSRVLKLNYNDKKGCFYKNDPNKASYPQIISYDGNEIIMKDYVGWYQDDENSPRREDVWRYQKYVLEENPDWDDLLKQYILDFNPEDYGMK